MLPEDRPRFDELVYRRGDELPDHHIKVPIDTNYKTYEWFIVDTNILANYVLSFVLIKRRQGKALPRFLSKN